MEEVDDYEIVAVIPEVDVDECGTPKDNKWSDEAMKNLVILFAKHIEEFNNWGTRNNAVWDKISQDLLDLGFRQSARQCHQKWRNMRRAYRDSFTKGPKEKQRKCFLYDELCEVYKMYKPYPKEPRYSLDINAEDESSSGVTDHPSAKRARTHDDNVSSSYETANETVCHTSVLTNQQDARWQQMMEMMERHHRETTTRLDKIIKLLSNKS